jgi:hexokinase
MTAQGADFLAHFGFSDVSETDRRTIREICRIVSTRSAKLAGAAIAAVVTWMDAKLESEHTIAIDGSLFEKYPGFQDQMIDILHDLFGSRCEDKTRACQGWIGNWRRDYRRCGGFYPALSSYISPGYDRYRI